MVQRGDRVIVNDANKNLVNKSGVVLGVFTKLDPITETLIKQMYKVNFPNGECWVDSTSVTKVQV